ncbi:CopM family metallochaperone [Chelatococcus reniformis]|uniref:DUF305 domain-containing protein n=1 Tax=Chelatococcus reniformis TaxID=1494448 RepID=A0A916U681_9HYPH|nr:DUF305 domain-containing protein [Chelatococcus reniformis]GGC61401.1 hypothetical protein GCM10010994_19970 [Chelatococcus reniformis]
MTSTIRPLTATAVLAASIGAAAAQSAHDHAAPATDGAATHGMHQGVAPTGEAVSTKAFKAADNAMMRNMQVVYTGDADVDFRTHMIPHHQGAIDMARVALTYATDPATRALAQKIIDDQLKEIADMQAWLRTSGASRSKPRP